MKLKKLILPILTAVLMLLITTSVFTVPAHAEIDLSNARVVTVDAFAYSPQDPGMGKYTASGTPLRRGVIAVDPNFIAMGTHVYIPNYGEAIAEDIGWNIKGAVIDIAFDTHEEAIYFGRQIIEIYILN